MVQHTDFLTFVSAFQKAIKTDLYWTIPLSRQEKFVDSFTRAYLAMSGSDAEIVHASRLYTETIQSYFDRELEIKSYPPITGTLS